MFSGHENCCLIEAKESMLEAFLYWIVGARNKNLCIFHKKILHVINYLRYVGHVTAPRHCIGVHRISAGYGGPGGRYKTNHSYYTRVRVACL